MAEKTGAKRYGLHLDLPGAPDTPHTIAGVNGHYWPTFATPVGDPGELPLGVARKVSGDGGTPLKLVEITKKEADEALERIARHRADNGHHLAEAARAGGHEGQIARDEMVATRPLDTVPPSIVKED